MLLRKSESASRRVRYDRAQLIPEVFLVEMCVVFLKFRHAHHRIGAYTCANQTVPYGTALLGWRFPRHFVPGYDRIVPPGHFATGFSEMLFAKCLPARPVGTAPIVPGISCRATIAPSLR